MADLTSRFHNRLRDEPGEWRHKAIPEHLAPSVVEREVLQQRATALGVALGPDENSARIMVKALLVAFPSFGETAEDANVLAKMYLRAVSDAPPWAVAKACSRFIEGKATVDWHPGRCPTPPQLAAECKAVAEPVVEELRKIGDVLNAVTFREDPEMQRRITDEARFTAALARFGLKRLQPGRVVTGRDTVAEAERERALRDLERLQSSDEPLTLSEDAKKIAGVA